MKFLKSISFSVLCFMISLLSNSEVSAQVEFELKPSQSMAITGKGPGQDAANNPYEGQDCLVLIENIGAISFSARIQQKGQKDLSSKNIAPGTSQTLSLPKGYELYLDTSKQGTAKARLLFKPKED